jgi:hypothetical protein
LIGFLLVPGSQAKSCNFLHLEICPFWGWEALGRKLALWPTTFMNFLGTTPGACGNCQLKTAQEIVLLIYGN